MQPGGVVLPNHNLKGIPLLLKWYTKMMIRSMFYCVMLLEDRMACSVFLCKTTFGCECIWDEIGEEMLCKGNGIICFYETSQMPTTLAMMYWAAQYHLYCHYTFAISSDWGPGMGRVHLPACMETYIRLAYPGDGNFVGFHERQGRDVA